jgi:hypothetical protein
VTDPALTQNADINLMMDTGLSVVMKNEAQYCPGGVPGADDCYYAKVLASITELGMNEGSDIGGQHLVIYGRGFMDSDDVTVTVDEEACPVLSKDHDKIICKTSAKTGPSATVVSGHNGIQWIKHES